MTLDIIHTSRTYSEKIKKNKFISDILDRTICNKGKRIGTLECIPAENKYFRVLDKKKFKNSRILFLKDKLNEIYFIVKEDCKGNNNKKVYEEINSLISSGKNNNFMTTFCIINLPKNTTLYIQEYFSYSFYDILVNHNGFSNYKKIKIFVCIIQRILISIFHMLKKDIIHSDLHLKNILINKSDNYEKITYKLSSEDITIPMMGYEIAITDFNESFIMGNSNEKEHIKDFMLRFFPLKYIFQKGKINKSICYIFDIYVFLGSIRHTLSNIMTNNVKEILNIINNSMKELNEIIDKDNIKKKDIYEFIINIIDLLTFEHKSKKIKMRRVMSKQ